MGSFITTDGLLPLIISVSRWRIVCLSADLSAGALTDVLQAATSPDSCSAAQDSNEFLGDKSKTRSSPWLRCVLCSCCFFGFVFVVTAVFETLCTSVILIHSTVISETSWFNRPVGLAFGVKQQRDGEQNPLSGFYWWVVFDSKPYIEPLLCMRHIYFSVQELWFVSLSTLWFDSIGWLDSISRTKR